MQKLGQIENNFRIFVWVSWNDLNWGRLENNSNISAKQSSSSSYFSSLSAYSFHFTFSLLVSFHHRRHICSILSSSRHHIRSIFSLSPRTIMISPQRRPLCGGAWDELWSNRAPILSCALLKISWDLRNSLLLAIWSPSPQNFLIFYRRSCQCQFEEQNSVTYYMKIWFVHINSRAFCLIFHFLKILFLLL